jgi:ferritin
MTLFKATWVKSKLPQFFINISLEKVAGFLFFKSNKKEQQVRLLVQRILIKGILPGTKMIACPSFYADVQ